MRLSSNYSQPNVIRKIRQPWPVLNPLLCIEQSAHFSPDPIFVIIIQGWPAVVCMYKMVWQGAGEGNNNNRYRLGNGQISVSHHSVLMMHKHISFGESVFAATLT